MLFVFVRVVILDCFWPFHTTYDICFHCLLISCSQMLSLNILVQVTMYFIAGLLPYLYLPLSALSKKARSTWGDQSSFSGFFVHLLRREYGTLDLVRKDLHIIE